MYMFRAYQSPASTEDCGPQCAQMPNFALRNQSGTCQPASDSRLGLKGPGAMPGRSPAGAQLGIPSTPAAASDWRTRRLLMRMATRYPTCKARDPPGPAPCTLHPAPCTAHLIYYEPPIPGRVWEDGSMKVVGLVAVLVGALLAPSLAQPAVAQTQTASQFYMAYRAAFDKAKKVEDLIPFMAKKNVDQMNQTPAGAR